MLGVEVAANLHTGFRGDHQRLTFVLECVERDRRNGRAADCTAPRQQLPADSSSAGTGRGGPEPAS
jgi:hypothetical protein